jgi:hypothetical protein
LKNLTYCNGLRIAWLRPVRRPGGQDASGRAPQGGVPAAELKDAVVIWSLPDPAIPSEGVLSLLGWRSFGFLGTGPYPLASTNAFEGGITTLDAQIAEVVPEPDTLALLGGALAVFALVMLIRRKRRGK